MNSDTSTPSSSSGDDGAAAGAATAAPPSATATATPAAAPVKGARHGLAFLLPALLPALLLAGALGWHWFDTRQQLTDIRQEAARRLADAEKLTRNELESGRNLRENHARIEQRLTLAEQRLAESRDQEAALQGLYRDVARVREEAAVLEVEQAVMLAVQQLQLAGNVPVALLALRSADAQLARLDKAAHLPLRKALAADIDQLNALPLLDLPGVSLRLDQLLTRLDQLPLAVYGRPLEPAENAPPDELGADAPSAAVPWWRAALADIWQEARSLIRVQRFDGEAPALMAPEQTFFLRENLKLRLLSARLALFARDQQSYRSDLVLVRDGLRTYFAGNDRAVQAATTQLEELLALDIRWELPELRASQKALLALRDAGMTP